MIATSQELNIYALFFFTIKGYYNIKRFKIFFHFFLSSFLVAESAAEQAADFAFFFTWGKMYDMIKHNAGDQGTKEKGNYKLQVTNDKLRGRASDPESPRY